VSKVTLEQIRGIWAAHGLDPVRSIVPTPSGLRNESYIVNDALVIRFNTQDPQFAKFSNERAAYDLLAHSTLRVPTVVTLDESRKLVPYDYIITTRLPGANVAESRATLTPAEQEALAWEAGVSLAQLHAFPFERFGKLRDPAHPPFPTWPAFFRDYVQRYMDPARQYGLVDAGTLARLRAVLGRTHDLLARVERGVLVHSDFHYENLLQEGGRLTGILDFEWALAGDPTVDFMAAPTRERQLPGSEAVFLAGYRSLRRLDADHDRRLAVYQLFLALETAVTDHRQGNPAGVQPAFAEMVQRLEQIENA
jgi:aminoglycoside phosphotransferase (APT) family kinase protein